MAVLELPVALPLELARFIENEDVDISDEFGILPVGLADRWHSNCAELENEKVGATVAVLASALTLFSLFENEKTAPHNSATQNMGVSI
ncbi:MAG: hypothetical protein K2O44_01510 [Clostridia bacterium]|nr:hypothetical protein [Clostridia bacterium]